VEALRAAPAGLPLRDVSRLTGVNKSTAYRILAHLEREGYLFRGNAGAYFIGPKLARIGSASDRYSTLREVSRPILHELWEVTNETVNLAVPDGSEVLYLDVIVSPHSFRLVSHAGMRRQMHCTALGKAVMAHLPDKERDRFLCSLAPGARLAGIRGRPVKIHTELIKISRQGYAVDDQESTPGVRCVAAPVFETANRVVAAISISGPITRIGNRQMPALAASILKASQTISARLTALV
jgi:DNA-binding IclR family transcriptional regulator